MNELTVKDIKELTKALDNVLGQLSGSAVYFIDEEFIKNCDEYEKEKLESFINEKIENNINKILILTSTYDANIIKKIPISKNNLKETFENIVNLLKNF